MAEAAREHPAPEPSRSARVSGPVRALTRVPAGASHPGWQVADAFLGAALLLLVLIAGNIDRMPEGLDGFLAVRLSVKNVVLLGAFGFAWPLLLWSCGLYDAERLENGRGEWPRILVASAVAGGLALAFPLTSRSGAAQPVHALLFAVLVAPAAVGVRAAVRAARAAGRRGQLRRTLIVGSGPIAAWVYRGFHADRDVRHEVVGFVDTEPREALSDLGVPHLGGVDRLERLLMHEVVDEVYIALPVKSRYEEIQRTIEACERVGVPATYPAPLFRTTVSRPRIERRGDTAVMALPVAADDLRLVVKRAMDVVGSATLLVGLSPLLLVIAAAVKLSSPGPVLFRQERYGYMKRRFRMLKFRTMVEHAELLQTELEIHNEADGPVFKIREDPRVTPIGRFLRKSSLDELPQLWHVLTGEMSLVGPRPLPMRDVGRFAEPWLMRRFSVRPGLTCLWQIAGRSELGFDRWIALDLQYIDEWSISLDLKILLHTVPAVLRGRGAT